MVLTVFFSFSATFAGKLDYREYDVRFTNPKCKTYNYPEDVLSVSGKPLRHKPKNAYCSNKDYRNSANQSRSPSRKIMEWIRNGNTKEIFIATLSFSNKAVQKALCSAIEDRGVRVEVVMDSKQKLDTVNRLKNCRTPSGSRGLTLHLRGHEGGIGWAHNKLFMVNPGSRTMRIAFTSANLSSGLVLHHENWHFVTLPRDTYFAQAHLCLREGMIESGNSARRYSSSVRGCLREIPYTEESDIKMFHVPGRGDRAFSAITKALDRSRSVSIAAHRFVHSRLIKKLKSILRRLDLWMVVDDDIYWAGQGQKGGPNTSSEYRTIRSLQKQGAEVKYMETRHHEKGIQLHHNKFMVFDFGRTGAVFAGAGNFTGAAFSSNFENFYYITIPHVVRAFEEQFEHLYTDLATDPADLPEINLIL